MLSHFVRVLIVFFVGALCSYGAPTKVESKTAAAKAPPAGAIGAKVVKKTKAVAKKTTQVPQKSEIKGKSKNSSSKTKVNTIKKESVVDKFAPQFNKKEKTPEKKKKVKMRKQVIDGKVCVWGRTPEDSELSASDAVRKFVGRKNDFQFKDSTIASDGGKFYCMLRFNFTDQIPETWYLETEMTTGFGKNKLRAFADAVTRARSRVKSVSSSSDWNDANSSIKNAGDMGFIPYDFVFAKAGDTTYCKIFFRYLKQR